MTHDELLAKVENQTIHIANKIRPVSADCEKEIGGFANALRAVVELHKPKEIPDWVPTNKDLMCWCAHIYPCPTIQAIEKKLK